MFTGLIAERGTIRKARRTGEVLQLEIDAGLARELSVGDSVSVNGVCLTATKVRRRWFRTEAMTETLERTTIGSLERAARVNLELPLKLSDRLGGHIVQGHVDGTARVVRIEDDGDARRIWFQASKDLVDHVVPKGSICVDGVSLTVVEVGRATFQVALIPHTLEVTTFDSLDVDDVVNLEVDVLAKYVERLLRRDGRESDPSPSSWTSDRKE
jgi:riboflavin synthase